MKATTLILLTCLAICAAGCSTEQQPNFSDPNATGTGTMTPVHPPATGGGPPGSASGPGSLGAPQ